MPEWKDILGYEGVYKISNEGRVMSLKFGKQKLLKNSVNSEGYFTVGLNRKTYHIHRLVAEHFLDKPEGKSEIDHIDGNRLNNDVKNLRWVTHKENHNTEAAIKNHKKQRKGIDNRKNNIYLVDNYMYYI